LVFVADPEIAYQRKRKDHPASLLEYQKQFVCYQNLAKVKKFIMIDTSNIPVEQVAERVLDLIFKKL